MYAKHAEDRNRIIADRNKRFRYPELFAQSAGSGMTDEQARAELKRFDDEGKTEALQKLADTAYKLNEKRLQIMIDGDLITKEQADEWRQRFGKFYVPLKGLSPELSNAQVKRLSILSEKKAAGKTPLTDTEQDEYEHLTEISAQRPVERPRIGRGFSLRGKEVQAAYGRRSQAQHILANVVNDINSSIIRAEKNKVGQAMLAYARKHPDPTVFEIESFEEKPYFSAATGEVEYREQPLKTYRDRSTGMVIEPMIVKERGKPVSLLIKDPALAGAMQNLGSEKMGKLLQAMGTFSKYFSLINTQVSPEFILTNLTRDIQTALINVTGVTDKAKAKGAAVEVAKNIPKAIRGASKGLHNEENRARMRDVQTVALQILVAAAVGIFARPRAHPFQAAVRISQQPVRVFLEQLAGLRDDIRSHPQTGLQAQGADPVGQPFHAVREAGIALPIAMPALVAFVHLDVFQAKRLAQRVGLLLDGKLIELADVGAFFESPQDPRTGAFVRGEMVY